MQVTLRQFEVLCHLKECGVVSTGTDSSILKALSIKGLVIQHMFSQGQNIYYHWSLAKDATAELTIR